MQAAEFDLRGSTDGTIYATEQCLSDYQADDPDPMTLMSQGGFLTISVYDVVTGYYALVVPNGQGDDLA